MAKRFPEPGLVTPSDLGQTLMLVSRDFHHRLTLDLKSRGVEGVSARHNAVFLYLGRNGPSRAVDLALAAGIRPQSMMKIVHELEEMGLVTRQPDPDDSRAKLIDFTARGRRFIAELRQSTETVWQQYADLLGETALQDTMSRLNRLVTTA